MRYMWWWFFSLWSYGVRSFFLEFRLLPMWVVLWFFKELQVPGICKELQPENWLALGIWKKSESEDCQVWVFQNLEEPLGFMKEPLVLCLCFTGWSCGGCFTFWSPLVICVYNQSDLQQRTGLLSKNCPTLGYFLILDLLLYRQEILTWSVRITLHQLQKWNSLRRVTFSTHGEAFHPFRWGLSARAVLMYPLSFRAFIDPVS